GKASRSCWAVHSAVAWTATAKCTIRRRSCAHEKHIEELEPGSSAQSKKSADTVVFTSLSTKVRQVCEGDAMREGCASAVWRATKHLRRLRRLKRCHVRSRA